MSRLFFRASRSLFIQTLGGTGTAADNGLGKLADSFTCTFVDATVLADKVTDSTVLASYIKLIMTFKVTKTVRFISFFTDFPVLLEQIMVTVSSVYGIRHV